MNHLRSMARGTRTAIAVALACLVASSGACSMARQAKMQRGADVVVRQTGGERIKGELVGVRPDAIVVDTKKGPATVPISEIESLWTVRKTSKDGRVALGVAGIFGGAALGVGTAKALNVQASDMGDAIGKGSLFLLGGMLVGEGLAVLIGTRTHKGMVYELKNKTPEEVALILTDLRKLARVPDYL